MDVDREFRGLAPLERPLAPFAGTFLPARSLPTPVLSCYLRPRYSALSRNVSANSLSTSLRPLTPAFTTHHSPFGTPHTTAICPPRRLTAPALRTPSAVAFADPHPPLLRIAQLYPHPCRPARILLHVNSSVIPPSQLTCVALVVASSRIALARPIRRSRCQTHDTTMQHAS